MAEEWQRLHVLNYEMESSTLLTLCGALGLRGGCVTGVINRAAGDGPDEPIAPEHLRLGEDHAVRVGIEAMRILIARPPAS
jgi:uridine phosphorylase